MAKFLCICLSSTLQKTISFQQVALTKVNRSTSYRIDASGKAVNSARVLSQLEKNCAKVICPLGKENASLFIDLISKDNIELSYIEIPGFTRECCTLLDLANKTTTELVISEPASNQPLPSVTEADILEEQLLTLIKTNLPIVDAVLLSGSCPSIWNDDLYPKIAKLVSNSDKLFLADFWATDLLETLKITIPSIIKINDEEFCKTFECNTDNLKTEIISLSKKLNNMIIVTRGTDPTFAAEKGSFYECPIIPVGPLNTTACGDSFNAGFIYEYVASKNFLKSLEKGTWAAAQNAKFECPGTIKA